MYRTRQWDPVDREFVSHKYTPGVRRSANREHDYEQFKANFYVPTKRCVCVCICTHRQYTHIYKYTHTHNQEVCHQLAVSTH